MRNFAIQRAASWPKSVTSHERRAVALPVRLPDSLYGPLPIRHVNTIHLRRFVLMMQYQSASAVERHAGVRSACVLYAIRRIEDRLSTTLFIRDATTLYPTAAAHRLYPCAVRLLAMWDALIADLQGDSRAAPVTSVPSSQPPGQPALPTSQLPAKPLHRVR